MRRLFALIAFIPSVAFAALTLPAATGFLNDSANMMSVPARTEIEAGLMSFREQTRHEIAVATIPSLEGEPIENVAVALFEKWGVGTADADNGVLLLIARDEREIRIEVGYGLEGALTDIESKQIIDNVIVPLFQAGDIDGGVRQGVFAIQEAIKGEFVAALDNANTTLLGLFDAAFPFLVFFFWFFLNIFLGLFAKTKSWWLGGVFGAVIALVVGLVMASVIKGVIAGVLLIPAGLLIDYVASKIGPRMGVGRGGSFMGGGRHWGGGSGGGFGGFGGGGSGGGGASGRW